MKKVDGDGFLKKNVTQIYKYSTEVEVQRRRFEPATERLGNKKSTCVVPPFFYACAFKKHFSFAEEDEK